jgi:peptidyl-prolyl cis-trans isomerase C
MASFGAKHILVNTLNEAVTLRQLIVDGTPFESAAMQSSLCPSKAAGGDLGPFSSGQMVVPFEQAVANMEVGALSQPVQTQFGYHLIKRTA